MWGINPPIFFIFKTYIFIKQTKDSGKYAIIKSIFRQKEFGWKKETDLRWQKF